MARYTSVPGLCLCSRLSTDNGEMKSPQEKPCYRASLNRRVVAEAVGTAMLLMAIVGSGIMGERLAAGNNAIALLANSLATGAALFALILTFGPISGAHFNPAVTFSDASQGGLPWREVPAYVVAQISGAFLGVALANVEVLKEIGIDVSRQTSKDVKQFLSEKFDYVITVCDRAKQHCPVFPGAEPIHWGFDDPAEAPAEKQLEAFRRARNEIQQRLRLFLLGNQK